MNKTTTIYFDLDGTLYDLYGQAMWLERITKIYDPSVYGTACTLVSFDDLSPLLDSLVEQGYRIGVVSWCAKNAPKWYDAAVREIKRDWVKRFLPQASEVHIVKYGTPKHRIVRDRDGIIVDDDATVREAWRGLAIDPAHGIIESLERLVA
jgi:FMN phosphatase YigB (HAD superfamily)